MSKKDYRSTSLQSSVARVDIRNGSNEWRMRDRFGAIALLGLNLRRKSARSEPTKHMRSLCGLNIFYKKEEKDTSKCKKNLVSTLNPVTLRPFCPTESIFVTEFQP